MNMQLISVNVGEERAMQYAKESGRTGIYKIPTPKPVEITPDGLAGDVIIDVENHGGVDQAVYVYSMVDYVWWTAELRREMHPGLFGDNLTISGLETAPLQIGDRLRVGAVVLEITSPRIPCVTLATRMGDPAFVKKFAAAERPGLYCRVIQPGKVQVGDPVSLEPHTGATLSVNEVFRRFYDGDGKHDEDFLRRCLAAPIAIRDRDEKQAQLDALLASRMA